jgi:hypothetical protein
MVAEPGARLPQPRCTSWRWVAMVTAGVCGVQESTTHTTGAASHGPARPLRSAALALRHRQQVSSKPSRSALLSRFTRSLSLSLSERVPVLPHSLSHCPQRAPSLAAQGGGGAHVRRRRGTAQHVAATRVDGEPRRLRRHHARRGDAAGIRRRRCVVGGARADAAGQCHVAHREHAQRGRRARHTAAAVPHTRT